MAAKREERATGDGDAMNLTTHYMGLTLKNPLVGVGLAALASALETIRSSEDAGAAAVVMFSLFEEQIRRRRRARCDYFMTVGHR